MAKLIFYGETERFKLMAENDRYAIGTSRKGLNHVILDKTTNQAGHADAVWFHQKFKTLSGCEMMLSLVTNGIVNIINPKHVLRRQQNN